MSKLTKLVLPLLLLGFAFGPGLAQAKEGPERGNHGGMQHGAPPRARSEHRGPRPSANHTWIGGYWEPQDAGWGWTAGRWELPSEGGTHWVKPRYHHDKEGYRYESGRWAR